MDANDPAVSPATAVANELDALSSLAVGAVEGIAVFVANARVVRLLVESVLLAT